jgi:zinc protease
MPDMSLEGARRTGRIVSAFAVGAAATALLVLAAIAAPVTQPARGNAINIPFERYTLANGLTVILAPDHGTPQAAVDVWYHVGSKNEAPGRTGFAHMFEHVMFTGSAHVPYGTHDRLTEGVGGDNNGSTSNDRTNYYENVPANYVESALWMEADRMGFLLDRLDESKFVAQRDIVQNERRQRTDNQPYGRAFEILASAMLPETHPYAWPVVGYMTDLKNATVDDVKDFFRRYYSPSNATLSIVGDFDPAQVRAWVTRYFGDLPAGPAVTRPQVPPAALTAARRLVYEDKVQVPRLYIAWPSAGDDHEDNYALEVMAEILAGTRTARLTKTLVYDRQWATSANAFNDANEKFGAFMLMLTPRPGHTMTELEACADSILAGFAQDGPTADELARALAGTEFGFVSALESNLGKAEMLNLGATFHGDPAYYRTAYARLKAVTAADVQRVAAKYLVPARVVLSMVPESKPEQASYPERSAKVAVAPDGGHYLLEAR